MNDQEALFPEIGVQVHEIHRDNRGYFRRVVERQAGFGQIVETSISYNKKMGTIRGMHMQIPPSTEEKYVSVLQGAIFDVVIDARPDSSNFGKWRSIVLSERNGYTIRIPSGFAHGFQTLENETLISYSMTDRHNPVLETSLHFDDPFLKIEWPLPLTEISLRDQNAMPWPPKF